MAKKHTHPLLITLTSGIVILYSIIVLHVKQSADCSCYTLIRMQTKN